MASHEVDSWLYDERKKEIIFMLKAFFLVLINFKTSKST